MPRYIRVRATDPKGCWRAAIFHGVKPVIYDKHGLSPDQVALLKAENGGMLLVDEIDDPESGRIVPHGDQIPGADGFTSHPIQQVDSLTTENVALASENGRLAAENERLRANLAAAVDAHKAAESARVNAEAERDAAKAEAGKPKPKPKPKPVDADTDAAATALDGAA